MNHVSNSALSPPLGRPQSQKGVAFSEAAGLRHAWLQLPVLCSFSMSHPSLPQTSHQGSAPSTVTSSLLPKPSLSSKDLSHQQLILTLVFSIPLSTAPVSKVLKHSSLLQKPIDCLLPASSPLFTSCPTPPFTLPWACQWPPNTTDTSLPWLYLM